MHKADMSIEDTMKGEQVGCCVIKLDGPWSRFGLDHPRTTIKCHNCAPEHFGVLQGLETSKWVPRPSLRRVLICVEKISSLFRYLEGHATAVAAEKSEHGACSLNSNKIDVDKRRASTSVGGRYPSLLEV